MDTDWVKEHIATFSKEPNPFDGNIRGAEMSTIEKQTEIQKRVIPFSPPDISESEINEVIETLRSGWITTGPRTKELEK